MNEAENVWKFPPHVEANQIDCCRLVGGLVEVMFEDGRGVDAPISAVRELMRVFGVGDVNELANMPVEVRSEPTVGFAQLADDVHVGRQSGQPPPSSARGTAG